MVNIEHIQTFVLAADKGSFSAAARHLRRSASSVSMIISTLEDQLGITLFDRSKKHPVLTPAGTRLYDHAQTLLRQANRIELLALSVIEEVEEKLTIGIGELIPFELIEEPLAKVIRKFANTEFEILRDSRQELERRFKEGHIDALIRARSAATDTDADFFQFKSLPVVCICSPDSELADQAIVKSSDLIGLRQICCASMLDNDLLSVGGTMSNDILTASSMHDLMNLVEQDLGWAYLPHAFASKRLQLGTLQTFQPDFLISGELSGIDVDLLLKPMASGPVTNMLKDLLSD
ncbi:LysR family transcriptional regulator [Paraferrimonas sedimenticola]|uniref:LysR family transcriptional regulator n=1 Tax=Paraferrimonas sedimenticola TaxID=375674 RepID=A0AA37W071_9GAMM|nr:LysR family transcriptional regulator [Paraferrimonas sedimenticola]GLP97614.1 LysR family transcriptional regulator [Paraferrimonas sedimenticola]